MKLLFSLVTACLECFAFIVLMVFAAGPAIPAEIQPIKPQEAIAIGRVGRSARSPVHTDVIEAQIVSGKWRAPAVGQTVEVREGTTRSWQLVKVNQDGFFAEESLQGGYAYVPVEVEEDCVMLLEAAGHSLVYVNGEPRAGDPYSTGYVHLPVALHRGTNDLLFASGRGRLKVTLSPLAELLKIDLADPTFPDLVAGRPIDSWGAVVVMNATTEPQAHLKLRAALANQRAVETPVPEIAPMSVRKVGFRLRGKAPESGDKAGLQLTLTGGETARNTKLSVALAKTDLRIRRPDQTQKRIFLSDIDGSVQYWALNPAQRPEGSGPAPALFLSLHGASVEALGQADAYSPKTWGNLAAPTNRRPYGFDWEAWGRMDALEVLAAAQRDLQPDPQRIYLTGHSMGGHGTWQVGVLFPDKFAAIGPSAGWISFASYAGGRWFSNATPVEAMLQRAGATSDTLGLATNYLQEGVYILHGSADDNVPAKEAHTMAEQLGKFHHDFQFFEQPGAGHWWDASDEPGADCVDWAPMFDFFAHHVIPADESVRRVQFVTVNPGVSSKCHWLEIQQQTHALEKSSLDIQWDPGVRRFSGKTENVTRFALDLRHVKPGKELKAELDGQKLEALPCPANGKLWLELQNEKWQLAAEASATAKNPIRYGPFKDAFRHRMLFVYGTGGTEEENRWAFAKARFDAESFWYRGNGSVDVIADRAFDPRKEPDRGVILYGNADSNRAWGALLGDSPVQVHRGEVRIGSRTLKGDDQACLFLRPRPGSAVACVAAVSGTGIVAMKLTDRFPYFLSGVDYADCTVIGAEMLAEGSKGIRAAGFFGLDWSVEKGEFAWRE